jgi:hypothetical protein
MKKLSPSIGGDPEFFIFGDIKGKHKIISADKILTGKENKKECTSGSYFFDGVQAEINPSHNNCREFFCRNIQGCLKDVYNIAKKKYDNIEFQPLASIKIQKSDVKGADNECLRFGCSPDFNIYSDEEKTYPDGKRFMTRFSGGHIHLGFSSINYMKKMKDPDVLYRLIKSFDYLAGIMSVLLSNGEEEHIRRKYYGEAGTYRIQKHGIEYRTLSSFWLVSPFIASLMSGLMRDAFTFVYHNKEKELLFDKISEEVVINTINNLDVKKARVIWEQIIKPLYEDFNMNISSPLQHEYVRNLIDYMISHGGYQSVFNPKYMINYWYLSKDLKTIDNMEYQCTYGIKNLAFDIETKYLKIEDIRNIGEE